MNDEKHRHGNLSLCSSYQAYRRIFDKLTFDTFCKKK